MAPKDIENLLDAVLDWKNACVDVAVFDNIDVTTPTNRDLRSIAFASRKIMTDRFEMLFGHRIQYHNPTEENNYNEQFTVRTYPREQPPESIH